MVGLRAGLREKAHAALKSNFAYALLRETRLRVQDPTFRSPPALGRRAPVLGHLREIRRDPLGLFARAAQVAPVTRIRIAGHLSFLISQPAEIRHVLVDNSSNFDKRSPGYLGLRRVLGNGLLTSEGELWRSQRRLAQDSFSRGRVDALRDTLLAVATRAERRLEAVAQRQGVVDLAQELVRVALEIIAESILGSDLRGDVDAIGGAMEVLVEDAFARANDANPFSHLLPTKRARNFSRAKRRIDEIATRAILRKRARPPGNDLLSRWMNARDHDGRAMSEQQLRDELVTVLLAGHETTASALTWTFILLAKSRDERTRMFAELDTVLSGRDPTIDELDRLPHTRHCFEEALRLYPPAWIFSRSPIEDDFLGPYRVPARSTVFISPWATHRHPELWEHPDMFEPDRFAADRSLGRAKFAFLPFGAGPRFCIGQYLATTEALIVLATLSRRLAFEPISEALIEPLPQITLRPRGGFLVRPTLRVRSS